MAKTCSDCGAQVNDHDKHRGWHWALDRKIDEALQEAKRAKRATKG